MRLRNLKDKDVFINECTYLIKNPENYKGRWQNSFNNKKPICLEIGMGKGDFIYQMAQKFPDVNFIGVEKYTGVLARAIKKHPDCLSNLKIINLDAKNLEDVFFHEIDTIYLNFSDPWPKERHASRRLSSPLFLNIYDSLFLQEKKIKMKTDNLSLFAYSLVSLSEYGYTLKKVSLDLDNDDDNVPTEYEMKFRSQGVKINYLYALKK